MGGWWRKGLDEGDEKRWWEDIEGMYWPRCHQRDGERYLRDGLVEGAYKRDGGRLWRCAVSAEIPGVRERDVFVSNSIPIS